VLERKQLMIACALATQPRLLLLDEPVGGLNPREIDQTIQLIKKIGSEWSTTIVLIEHVMRFVVALCDRAVIMHRGRKIYDGPTSGLANDRSVVEVYLGSAAADRLQRLIVSSHA
jgi:branched-chain amino acid transport system ATP-binding protein